MNSSLIFFLNSILLGTGLAMDAFSVSLANGLNETKMKTSKMCAIAGMFSFFQFLMPVIGYTCVHTISQHFKAFEKFIPFIALVLLLIIGGKMLYEGKQECQSVKCGAKLGVGALIVQGIATSIDALSVGFTIASYTALEALICCFLIAVVTFLICMAGVVIGKRCGTALSEKATVFGGIILIFIGIEIFVSSII